MNRWTQWIFIQLFNKGLAYQAEVPVNWCPALGTVLANEEIIDGKSERGDHPVVRMPMKQVHVVSFSRLVLPCMSWGEALPCTTQCMNGCHHHTNITAAWTLTSR